MRTEILKKTNLFTAGEDNYILYRNPGIATTGSGAVLIFTEARRAPEPDQEGSDWAASAIFMRRSADNGETWEAKRLIDAHDRGPTHNPTPIKDRLDGNTLHFLYGKDYKRVYYRKTTDNGLSFSDPVDITYVFDKFKPEYDWKVVATGIGHGIQLKNGRLVVPVWLSLGLYGGSHRPSRVSVIYSDDGGQTWERGEILEDNLVNPSETQAAELDNGSVLLNIRNESPEHRRAYSVSADGATGWSEPALDSGLYEPVCCAGILRVTDSGSHGKNRIIFCNPDPLVKFDENWLRNRSNLTLRLSYDDCKTWAVSKVLEPDISGYSDLSVSEDGFILCAYDRSSVDGRHFNKKYVCLAKFNLEWLTDGKDSLGA